MEDFNMKMAQSLGEKIISEKALQGRVKELEERNDTFHRRIKMLEDEDKSSQLRIKDLLNVTDLYEARIKELEEEKKKYAERDELCRRIPQERDELYRRIKVLEEENKKKQPESVFLALAGFEGGSKAGAFNEELKAWQYIGELKEKHVTLTDFSVKKVSLQ